MPPATLSLPYGGLPASARDVPPRSCSLELLVPNSGRGGYLSLKGENWWIQRSTLVAAGTLQLPHLTCARTWNSPDRPTLEFAAIPCGACPAENGTIFRVAIVRHLVLQREFERRAHES